MTKEEALKIIGCEETDSVEIINQWHEEKKRVLLSEKVRIDGGSRDSRFNKEKKNALQNIENKIQNLEEAYKLLSSEAEAVKTSVNDKNSNASLTQESKYKEVTKVKETVNISTEKQLSKIGVFSFLKPFLSFKNLLFLIFIVMLIIIIKCGIGQATPSNCQDKSTRIKKLFRKCENSEAWKKSLKEIIGKDRVDVIIGGIYRIGTIEQLFDRGNVCDFKFDSLSVHKNRNIVINQLYLSSNLIAKNNDFNCLNEDDISKMAEILISKFYANVNVIGDNTLPKRHMLYNEANKNKNLTIKQTINLFVDTIRRVEFIKSKRDSVTRMKEIPKYLREEILDIPQGYKIVLSVLDNQIIEIKGLTQLNDNTFQATVSIYQKYEKYQTTPTPEKDLKYKSDLIYQDTTPKFFDIIIKLEDCIDEKGVFMKNGCCAIFLGDIEAESIISLPKERSK